MTGKTSANRWISLIAVFGIMGGGCKRMPTAAEAELRRTVTERLAVLDKIAKDWPAEGAERRCEAGVLVNAGAVPAITYGQLRDYAGYDLPPQDKLDDRNAEITSRQLGLSNVLRKNASRQEIAEIAGTDTTFAPRPSLGALPDLYKAKLVAVVRTFKLTIPSSVMLSGTFVGGDYLGGVRLFDMSTGRLLCQAKIAAPAPAEVKKELFQSGTDAVRADFKKRMDAAKNEAVARIAPGLSMSW